MKAVICSEDEMTVTCVRKLMDSYMDRIAADSEICAFDADEPFLSTLKEGMYDLIFLDITMEHTDALELGIRIRQQGISSFFIYIAEESISPEGLFDTEPIALLKKPIDSDAFDRALNRIFHKVSGEQYFKFQMNYKTTRVKLKNIVFFESRGRKIRITLSNEEVMEFYGKLDDVERNIREDIHSQIFVRKHKSFLVNESFICKIERNELTLKNGRKIPISRIHQNT